MTDDLSCYFERMAPKVDIRVCADCEARQGERHRGVRLTTSGIAQLIVRLFKEKGVGRITPHDLRHTFATHFMEDETARQEDLMTIAGWNDPAMARRYTKSRRQARALTAHRRLSPVGRLA